MTLYEHNQKLLTVNQHKVYMYGSRALLASSFIFVVSQHIV